MLEKQIIPFAIRRWRSLLKFISLFSLCCFLAVSCGDRTTTTSPEASTSTAPGRVTIGMTSKPRTLDPADAYEIVTGTLLYNLGDRLYTYESGTTNLKPQLATELPKISDDGLTYTIPLRQGVQFHDGTPFNAEAMVFSLKRFIENAGQPSFLLADTVDSIHATGEYELTIKLKSPFAGFPDLLSFFGACAVSPKAYEIGAGKFQPSSFVGTDPYKLANYGNNSLKLDVFEEYWGEKPANQGIDISLLSSPSNLFNSFRTGAVDVAYQTLDLEQIATLQDRAASSGWQVIETRSNGIYYLTLNVKSPPLDQIAVRQAIAAAIDRNQLKERVFRNQVEPLYSLIPLTLDKMYQPVLQQEYGDGNTEKAKALLSQAGYSQSNPLKLELWYRSSLKSNADAASTIKASFQQRFAGLLDLELKSVEAATAYENLDKGTYPMFLLDWSPDFLDADNYIQPFMDCAKGSAETGCEEGSTKAQGSFYYNERVNELIDLQRKTQNPEERQKIFAELQKILAQDVPFIPLWEGKEYMFAQKGIQGVIIEPTQRVPFWTMSK